MPKAGLGRVLVRNQNSLVSAGTERMIVDFAEKSLIDKARSRPDLVAQTIEKAKREGVLSTWEAVQNRLDQRISCDQARINCNRPRGCTIFNDERRLHFLHPHRRLFVAVRIVLLQRSRVVFARRHRQIEWQRAGIDVLVFRFPLLAGRRIRRRGNCRSLNLRGRWRRS